MPIKKGNVSKEIVSYTSLVNIDKKNKCRVKNSGHHLAPKTAFNK